MFGLKYKSISRERAYFMCVTDKGTKAVKKAASAEIVMVVNSIKARLEENGIATNKFCVANNGLPYVTMGYDIYTVSDYISYKTAAFSEPQQFKAIIETVAKMHLVCREMDVPDELMQKAQLRISSFEPDEIFFRNSKALKDYKKVILKKSRISDFDMVLLSNFERFMDALNNWFAAIKQCGKQFETQALQSKQICHNLLKEENILIDDSKIYLTGFSEISVAHGMNDLAALVKRYIKSCPQDAVSLAEILDTYNAVVPLYDDERDYFKSLLLFPDKFLEICRSYYSKKRAFTPRTFETRMDALIDNYEFFEKYTSGL